MKRHEKKSGLDEPQFRTWQSKLKTVNELDLPINANLKVWKERGKGERQ